MVTFPLSLPEGRGDFSSVFTENLIELLEIKLTKVWVPLDDWLPLKFLYLRFVYTEPPEIVSYG